ncbi:hypothetical protein JVU11DRAFT_6917 [Chiua virens]|nr:hypothetical protein JVU11DRAFT_6917 [Chiua virens]
MPLLNKNQLTSFEDVARLSHSPAGGISPKGLLAKLSMQSLRNAGVPQAKSMPHINFSAERGSLKTHCSAVFSADISGFSPRQLIARKVKSAKDDLRQLFDGASSKQRVEPARRPSDTELASSAPVSRARQPNSPDPEDEQVEDHFRCLTATAQAWLDFERLFSRRRSLLDSKVEEARHEFCQALVQSFSDQPPQVPRSSVDAPSSLPSSAVSSSVQFESAASEERQPPEFSDEDLAREFDEFSFHSSQEEDWTSEVESRKQNAMNQVLSDMKRKLAVPIPKLSSYLSDNSLADSVAHQANPRSPSKNADNVSFYSPDDDETDGDHHSLPDSPVFTDTLMLDIDATASPPLSFAQASPHDASYDADQEDEDNHSIPMSSPGLCCNEIRNYSCLNIECYGVNEDRTPNTEKTLRRVTKFADLKSTTRSSLEVLCEKSSLYEEDKEDLPSEFRARRLRRVPGCLDLRAFGCVTPRIETPPNVSGKQPHSLQSLKGLKVYPDLKQRSSNLEDGETPSIPPRVCSTTSDHIKPPIPPKPPGFRIHRRARQLETLENLSSTIVEEPSSTYSHPDSFSSFSLWSCSKITRSKRKRGRPLRESIKSLEKRFDSVCIDTETIHSLLEDQIYHPRTKVDRRDKRLLGIPKDCFRHLWVVLRRRPELAKGYDQVFEIPRPRVRDRYYRPMNVKHDVQSHTLP